MFMTPDREDGAWGRGTGVKARLPVGRAAERS